MSETTFAAACASLAVVSAETPSECTAEAAARAAAAAACTLFAEASKPPPFRENSLKLSKKPFRAGEKRNKTIPIRIGQMSTPRNFVTASSNFTVSSIVISSVGPNWK